MKSLLSTLSPGSKPPATRSSSITSFTSSVSATTEKRPASLPSVTTSLGIPDCADLRPGWCAGEEVPPIKDTGATTRAFFEEVLRGRRPAPWRPEFFLDHCESELNAESLYFYYEVEGMKRLSGDASAVDPSDEYLLVPKSERSTPRSWAERVLDMYVKNDAPEQVNISAAQREATLKRMLNFDELGPRIFDEPQAEVVKLMHHDVFPRFAKSVLSTNINERSRRRMFVEGALLALVLLAAQAACLAVFVPRPYYVLFFVPWLVVANQFHAAIRRFCVQTCMRDVVYVGGSTEAVACPVAKGYLHARAKVVLVKLLVAAALLTVLPILLSFAVEAGLGRGVLY